ncbi:DUF2177 family protein [Flavobacteriaceae bacterium]|nr:DUF2177 family protein [Flavobacteriaceae bacterium]|tara:strand:+ start:1526 stop:1897 length:372 start_codon:yes stop_codon:yes gene_type:complete
MDYIIPAFSMLFIDSVYLSNIGGPMFDKMVKKIQKDDMKINIYGAIGAYILMILAIYKFIIMERKPPMDAFILGLCIYGVFDFTNYAIFKNYSMMIGLLDMVWGGILYYIVTVITYKLLGIKY